VAGRSQDIRQFSRELEKSEVGGVDPVEKRT
jgi:hypothetical protein